MKINNKHVYGIMDALRGMRNPLNSWEKNDSRCTCDMEDGHVVSVELGPNDTRLCKALILGGSPHRKYLRQIFVTMDITAPSYWWAEMDTYKASTTRNSCSLQHKGASRDFTEDDFEIDEDISMNTLGATDYSNIQKDKEAILDIVNRWRREYANNKDEYTYFRLMRQFMPMGYNYRATWSGNYENLLNIYEWRKEHRLREWHEFCDAIVDLPLMDVLLEGVVAK